MTIYAFVSIWARPEPTVECFVDGFEEIFAHLENIQKIMNMGMSNHWSIGNLNAKWNANLKQIHQLIMSKWRWFLTMSVVFFFSFSPCFFLTTSSSFCWSQVSIVSITKFYAILSMKWHFNSFHMKRCMTTDTLSWEKRPTHIHKKMLQLFLLGMKCLKVKNDEKLCVAAEMNNKVRLGRNSNIAIL